MEVTKTVLKMVITTQDTETEMEMEMLMVFFLTELLQIMVESMETITLDMLLETSMEMATLDQETVLPMVMETQVH